MKKENVITAGLLLLFVISCLSCMKLRLTEESDDGLNSEFLEHPAGPVIGDTGWIKQIVDEDTILYTTVRAADGLVWLQQNLGSTRVASALDDTSAYGDLYQWGRWADGHQVRNPTNLFNGMPYADPSELPMSGINPFFYHASPATWWGAGVLSDQWLAPAVLEVTATNGCDPCRALGEGWRLPYNTEWVRLIERENIADIQDAFDSNLKLVAGGHLNGINGAFFRVGTRGYYWSSTAAANGNAIATHFWETSILPSNADRRGNGFSIRCIKGDTGAPGSAVPGVVIAHSPSYQRAYIGSPSIVKLANGDLIASHDLFGPNAAVARPNGQSITRIYRSTDEGETWTTVTDLEGQFMSGVFLHNGALYVMGVSGGYNVGNHVVIRKSTDNGNTWSTPASNNNGRLLTGRYHTAPTPVLEHGGRIWRAMEDANGPSTIFAKRYRAMMMSAPADSDLLDSLNWTISNPLAYDTTYLNGYFWGWLEGNAVISPTGDLLNVLRVHTFSQNRERIARANISADGTTATFDPDNGFSDMPGGGKKFSVRFDSTSSKYWTLANYVPGEFINIRPLDKIRNTLALCSSTDLVTWSVDSIIIQHPDIDLHGYQYVDWQFDGNDIIAVSRTSHDDGIGGAANYHDSNYLTFHRITNFRD